MNVNELSGTDLDWEVARREGFTDYDPTTGTMLPPRKEYGRVLLCDNDFSTNWELGGPIIEREGISIYLDTNNLWQANIFDGNPAVFGTGVEGSTPLIAAMRCYVALCSK